MFNLSRIISEHCGTVFASIESSNIVGYQAKEVRQYLSVQIPTFDGVAATGIDIQSIKPAVAVGDELESGDFVIQFYNQYGVIETQYTWVLGEDIDDGYADGWYEEDMETLAEKTFVVGEAFNVMAAKDGGTVTCAGQVLTVQTVVPVRQYLSAQGNFRPVAVDIQSITPAVAVGDELESGDFVVQFYNQYGVIATQYTWVLGEDIDDGYADGWYEEDMETLAVKTFAAGEGFNIMAAKDGGSLTFPALTL